MCSTCYVRSSNPVRAVDVFVDELDLGNLGFGGVEPEATKGWPAIRRPAKMQRRVSQVDESIARYLSQLDSADRQGIFNGRCNSLGKVGHKCARM